MNLLDFWPTAEAITKCIPSEAEVISDEAFLAVHQPVRLFRHSLTNPDAPLEATNERKVLDALLSKHLPEGYVIVPVVGPSGVGKSHVIRWLKLHLPSDLHAILIPKSTSLRRILESILNGLEGPGYDEIRKQLATARETLDEIAARNLLLAHFRTALERRVVAAGAEYLAAKKRNEEPPAELRSVAETHGPGLVQLLEGPTKDALLQDEPKKSVFRALIRRVTTGIIDAGQAEFTAADFEFSSVIPSKLPDPKLQRYVNKLKLNAQNDRATAARLMNEVRDWAVGQLLGLGENQLADLFRRVREELFKDGKELVLLIEDFTTLAGVQQGLLDVIKMEGVRAGEAERCPLRTALAVTEGFLSPYDTLKTRVRHEFVLREQPAAEAELLTTITNMIGAYLNAARLGPARLKEWFNAANRNPDATPPSFESALTHLSNADRTAVEAFGKSDLGHRLFPFNLAAIKRMALQHLSISGQLRLNPRALITDVLHSTLLHYRDLFARGQFPPEDFQRFNANRLGFEVIAWLAKLRRTDHSRYAVLLGYWGDLPNQPEDVKLPAAIYKAFGLVPLSDSVAELESKLPPPPPPESGSSPPPPPPEVEDVTRVAIAARERVIQDWVDNRKIIQSDATRLRNDLLDMIDAAIDWDAELLIPRDLNPRPGKARLDEDEDEVEVVEIESGPPTGVKYKRARLRGAVGVKEVYLPFNPDKTGAAPEEAIFTLCRDEVFADPVAFANVRRELQALVRFHTHKTFDYPDGEKDRAWYARLSARAAAEAVRFLRKRFERLPDNPGAVTAAAQALYVSARVLDLPGAHSNQDAEVLRAVLSISPPLPPTAVGDGWQRFRTACATHRATARDFLLRRLAVRQGIGHVLYGIDANQLLEALKPVRKSCRAEVEFPGDSARLDENALQVRKFVVELGAERTEAAIADRRAGLARWAAETRSWLGANFKKDSFVLECQGLIRQASMLQVFSADVTVETLRAYAKEFDEAAVSEALMDGEKLKDDAAPGVVLTAVVKVQADAMQRTDTFRDAFREFEQQTLSRARSEISKKLKLAKADENADPESALAAEAAKLDADLRTIAIAAGGTPEELPTSTVAAAPAENATAVSADQPGRFASLAMALDRLSRVDKVAQQMAELEPIRSDVNDWAEDLPRLAAQHSLLVEREVAVEDAPAGAKVVNAVVAARTKVAESPLEITRGRTFTSFKIAVGKMIEEYRKVIARAWQAWLKKNAPNIDAAEFGPFEADPEYQQTVRDIRAKLAALRRYEQEPAESLEGFTAVEAVIDSLRGLLALLPTEAPADVKRFLAATNSRDGASLDMLTAAVSRWLQDNKQFQKYRIRR